LARILSVSERIRLFKEINRAHQYAYGWNLIYKNIRKEGLIDIERDTTIFSKTKKQLDESNVESCYFFDDRGNNIRLLRGLFAWEAYDFYHVNPYKFFVNYMREGDMIVDELGKRLRQDLDHPVKCNISWIDVQQRKKDGKIVISSNWLYPDDCYSAVAPFAAAIDKAIYEASGGDSKIIERLSEKYDRINKLNLNNFNEHLFNDYFKGRKLTRKCWYGGYVFAASKAWKIKTLEEFDKALKVEEEHFSKVLEELIGWMKEGGIRLGDKAEDVLREKVRKIYVGYPCGIAKKICESLVKEDKADPSDVYLWWGGEPNADLCYAILTLYFEVDPEEVGTSTFYERTSRNLWTLINVAEEMYPLLSTYKYIEPLAWRAIFS